MMDDLEEANQEARNQDYQRSADEMNSFSKLKQVLNETLSIHPKTKIMYEVD